MKTPALNTLFISAALSALLVGAASAAEPVRETRSVTQPFTSVKLVGPLDLDLTQGDATSITVEADKGQVGRIKTEVRDNVLVLSYESPMHITIGWSTERDGYKGPRVLLTTRALGRIMVEGSGDVRAPAWSTPEDLELSTSGSGDVHIGTLNARKLAVRIAGSSDITVGGSVAEQSVNIAGSGDYKAPNLKSTSAAISIAGSGDAILWATGALSISVAGSGDVKYYGKPTVSQSVAGSGDITGLGDKK